MRAAVQHGSSSLAGPSKHPLRSSGRVFLIPRSRLGPLPVAPPIQPRPNLGVRHQSTSSSRWGISDFFSRRSPPPLSSGHPLTDFRDAISADNLEALGRAYDALSTGSLRPSAADLEAALALLSSRTVRSPAGYALFKRIYDDLPSRWSIPLEERHYRLLVLAQLSLGRPRLAAATARDLHLQDAQVWRDILKAAIVMDPPGVDEIWAALASCIPVGPSEYTLLLSHLHINLSDTDTIRERLQTILRDMRSRSEWIGLRGEVELLYIQLKLGDLAKAEELVSGWDLRQSDRMPMWNAAAELAMARVQTGAAEGTESVEEVVREMLDRGIKPIQRVVTFLVLQELRRLLDARSTLGLEDMTRTLERVEEVCQLRAGPAVWAEVIYLLTHSPLPPSPSDVGDTGVLALPMAVYQEAKSRGVEISSTMARNVIRPLCSLDPPDLTRAMEVYADWSSAPLEMRTARDRERALDVFIPLLKACSSTPGTGATVIQLLRDLRTRGLPLPSNTATSLAISLMRQGADHAAAFDVYAHFYALNSAALVARDYEALLTAFISLRTPTSSFPPPHLYLEIVKDMKRAGYRPSSYVISALLHSCGQQATRVRKSSTDAEFIAAGLRPLEKAIDELHTVLRLDPLVEVDVPLLCSLMDAYNRLGAYGSAFQVWSDLVERRPREDPTRVKEIYGPAISVILDTCGWSNSLVRGRRIWAWAERHGLRNPRHYVTWVEALCRMRQMEEALEVMRSMQGDEGRAGAVEVLAKFSMTDPSEGGKRVREAIKADFPEEWARIRQRMDLVDAISGPDDPFEDNGPRQERKEGRT